MDEKNTKRMNLVEKMLNFIDECDGSADKCRKVLAAAMAVREIVVPGYKKSVVSMVSSDVEEEEDDA